ncbi:MAG TPA: hypothetical protein DDW52_20065 [Planctomycetaceae bacterium]|nr:hypothetical protein [Planctomycetaceae bacterium]
MTKDSQHPSDEEDLDLQSQMQAAQEQDDDLEDGEGLSLEQLSATYSEVLDKPVVEQSDDGESEEPVEGELLDDEEGSLARTTPSSIVEAVLFVGRSDNSEISGKEIADLMRGVDVDDVDRYVDELNASYAAAGHALAIQRVGSGYKMGLANQLQYVRDRFYGRIRDVKLNQTAIDCLALVAYQPGISRTELDEQRGGSSGPVLNQLVRRELLEVRREGTGKQATVHYFPTDKMLELAGLASLDDLPQVEEF